MNDYWSECDPYCYPGKSVLRNNFGIKDVGRLQTVENDAVRVRASLGLPTGRYSLSHYLACHKWLFGDVYAWAGKYRTVRLAKGQSVFCFPEHIEGQMRSLFGELKAGNFLAQQKREDFIERAAWFWSEINAIHPFREGNGRTQTLFLANLALSGGWYLDLTRLEQRATIAAMTASFTAGDGRPLENLVAGLIKV